MFIGIVLAIRQVWRLFPEVRWVNTCAGPRKDRRRLTRRSCWRRWPPFIGSRPAQSGPFGRGHPLAPRFRSAPASTRAARSCAISPASWCSSACSAPSGASSTPWARSGASSRRLRTGQDAAVLFDELKNSPRRRRSQGMGLSFSASLFGLAGSLVLGFLDLQAGQAQSRFYTELEDWLAISTMDTPAPISRPCAPATRHELADSAQPADRRGQRRRAADGRRPRPWRTSPRASRASSSTCGRSSR